jgi:hypothetical protein
MGDDDAHLMNDNDILEAIADLKDDLVDRIRELDSETSERIRELEGEVSELQAVVAALQSELDNHDHEGELLA